MKTENEPECVPVASGMVTRTKCKRGKEGRASVLTSRKTIILTARAKPAKLIPTDYTSHVVTALRQLNHLTALRTTSESTIIQGAQNKFSGLINLLRAFVSKFSTGFASVRGAGRAGDVLCRVSCQSQWLRARGTGTVECRAHCRGPITLTSQRKVEVFSCKEVFDVVERDGGVAAASGWPERTIVVGCFELLVDTVDASAAVFARKKDCESETEAHLARR